MQTSVHGRLLRDVPVDAQHLIVARPILCGLEYVVVLVRTGRIGGVRQREQIEERLAHGIDTVGRDHVAGEACWPARGRAAIAGQQRVAYEDLTALTVHRLREVATTFERRRHPSLIQIAGVGAGESILREEEEQLVASAVDGSPRLEHRAAKRPRAVIERVRRRVALCGLT